jgi:hypothetical protein
MSKIIWSFEGQNVTFQSTPENFDRDIVRMAKSVHLEVNHPIQIHYDDRNISTDVADSNVDTTCPTVATLSISTKKSKVDKKTVQLCDLPGNLGGSDNNDELLSSSNNSVADDSTSDWFDNQRA